MDSLICRVCLSTNSLEYIELEAVYNNITYLDCFNDCTQLSAKSKDELPSVLCSKCAKRLEKTYSFIMEAREADNALRNRMNDLHNSTHRMVEIITDNYQNGSFNDEDIENMEIVVLKPLESNTIEGTLLEEKPNDELSTYAIDKFDLCNNESTDYVIEIGDKKEKTWKCAECRKQFDSGASHQEHMNWHKKHNFLKCIHCLKDFRTQKSLERHMKASHKILEDAGKQQNSKQNCDINNFVMLLSCVQCNEVFTSKETLHRHEKHQHNSINTTSHKTFNENNPQETNEQLPMENLIEETLYEDFAENIIEHCETENSDSDNIKAESGDQLKECTVCKKILLERNMDKHLKTHTASSRQQDFLCTYCLRHFKNQKSFRQHEKTHFVGKSKTIACADCDRQYSTISSLEQHRRNTHKEKEHVCGICGNAFKLRNQLSNHMKLHLKKNIQCPHCEKKYARQYDLNVHLRSHTGEMPYECSICQKRFAIKVRLTYHLQKHYGIKHTCKECGKEFNSKQKLKCHSFRHTGMPYRCELCDHGFPNRDVFKRHLLRVHHASITEEALLEMFQRYTGKTTRIREVNISLDAEGEMGDQNSTLDDKIEPTNTNSS